MDLDYSFDALTRAGLAKEYFSLEKPQLADAGLELELNQFSITNAWWLAELCRLVYRQEADELGEDFDGMTRQAVLNQVGIKEVAVLKSDQSSTFAVLVSATDRNNTPCSVLIFRGSNEFEDWKNNILAYQVKAFKGSKVHAGFMRALRPIWKDLLNLLKQQQGSLFVTGHSLGAALATLATARLVKNGHAVEACYVFGSPRVGNKKFTQILSDASMYRVENGSDIVTSIPLDVPGIRYTAAGECHYLDHEGQLHHNATRKLVTTDRIKHGWSLPNPRTFSEWLQRLKSMPEKLPPMLADHAPINYVARLERCL
jgi:hypothetical protein